MNDAPETLVQGSNDFLITITYKKITNSDPGTSSNNLEMYGGATCEIKGGKILSGTLMQKGMTE
jgi:hypothetical protein